MSPEAFVSLIIGALLGFALGYGVRAGISSRRHARSMHRKMDFVMSPELQFTAQALTGQDNRASSRQEVRNVPSIVPDPP
jgi:hypothetical protein